FELVDQIAAVRVAGRHTRNRWLLSACDTDEQSIAVGLVEAQALRRAGAGMAAGADRREDLFLYRREGGLERRRAAASIAAPDPAVGRSRADAASRSATRRGQHAAERACFEDETTVRVSCCCTAHR